MLHFCEYRRLGGFCELREQADDLIDDIAAELRFNLRKKDPASRRRIMRTYGVKYRYLKGEPVEAE